MRTVKKETIDRLLEAVDEYGKELGSLAAYKKMRNWSEIAAEEIHGNPSYGTLNFALMELIRSLRIIHPIKYCTNEEIYALLKMLDIEVVEVQSNDR